MKNLLVITLVILPHFIFAQGFEIYNSSKSTIIPKSDFLELAVKINKDEDCCDYIKYEGYFVESSADSLVFDFSNSHIYQNLDNTTKNYNKNYLGDNPLKNIAKSDIVYLTNYSSKKNRKNRKTWSVVGGLIMIGGLVTSLNALVLADEDRSDLLIAGGVQFTTGLIIGLSSQKKRKKFIYSDDPWQVR